MVSDAYVIWTTGTDIIFIFWNESHLRKKLIHTIMLILNYKITSMINDLRMCNETILITLFHSHSSTLTCRNQKRCLREEVSTYFGVSPQCIINSDYRMKCHPELICSTHLIVPFRHGHIMA